MCCSELFVSISILQVPHHCFHGFLSIYCRFPSADEEGWTMEGLLYVCVCLLYLHFSVVVSMCVSLSFRDQLWFSFLFLCLCVVCAWLLSSLYVPPCHSSLHVCTSLFYDACACCMWSIILSFLYSTSDTYCCFYSQWVGYNKEVVITKKLL